MKRDWEVVQVADFVKVKRNSFDDIVFTTPEAAAWELRGDVASDTFLKSTTLLVIKVDVFKRVRDRRDVFSHVAQVFCAQTNECWWINQHYLLVSAKGK